MLKLWPPNGTLFDTNLEVFEKMNPDQQLHLAVMVQVEGWKLENLVRLRIREMFEVLELEN